MIVLSFIYYFVWLFFWDSRGDTLVGATPYMRMYTYADADVRNSDAGVCILKANVCVDGELHGRRSWQHYRLAQVKRNVGRYDHLLSIRQRWAVLCRLLPHCKQLASDDNSPPSTSLFSVNSRTLIKCTDLPPPQKKRKEKKRRLEHPHQCPLGVGSKLPLPLLHADVCTFR